MKNAAGTFGGSHAMPRPAKPKPSAGEKAIKEIGRFLVLPLIIALVAPLAVAWGYRIYATWPADAPAPPYYKTFSERLGE